MKNEPSVLRQILPIKVRRNLKGEQLLKQDILKQQNENCILLEKMERIDQRENKYLKNKPKIIRHFSRLNFKVRYSKNEPHFLENRRSFSFKKLFRTKVDAENFFFPILKKQK